MHHNCISYQHKSYWTSWDCNIAWSRKFYHTSQQHVYYI
jgi:hypothetical protein